RGGVVDARTDIYAAGVVLYELLTGKRLYEAGPEPDYRALAKKVAKGEHALPSEHDRVLAPYDDLVATALRPKQEDRYQSAAELRDSIQQSLVGVNPTISTDQLGSFMRELFSEEMTAQKELHDRIAKAHLDDFKEQLTTQTGTTVSFAFANLPLQAPPEPPVIPVQRARKPTEQPKPRAPTAPTDILRPQPTVDLSLADGTGAVPEIDTEHARIRSSRRGTLIAILAVAMVVVAGGVYAMTRPSGEPKPAAGSNGPSANRSNGVNGAGSGSAPTKITVESIPPSEQLPPGSNAAPAEVATGSNDTTKIAVAVVDHKKATTTSEVSHGRRHSDHARVATAEPKHAEPLTRDAVAGKFMSVKHEYDAYKTKNGGRLDDQWNDLATFMNFQLRADNLDEASRRIDAFRAKMKD
ncbi:MAG TPA: hypothetical protein VH143_27650, partial [Kofleriaceae bacterium]|nr:hypothetical protein [Kofleriaceae bacterium]